VAPIVHLLTVAAAGLTSRLVSRVPRSFTVTAQRRIGERLVARGLLSVRELEELLELQATSDLAWQRLGDLAVQQGYVDADQLAAATRG
jgi:hypothetical protein